MCEGRSCGVYVVDEQIPPAVDRVARKGAGCLFLALSPRRTVLRDIGQAIKRLRIGKSSATRKLPRQQFGVPIPPLASMWRDGWYGDNGDVAQMWNCFIEQVAEHLCAPPHTREFVSIDHCFERRRTLSDTPRCAIGKYAAMALLYSRTRHAEARDT